jgi:arylsulfatase A-like enzyme
LKNFWVEQVGVAFMKQSASIYEGGVRVPLIMSWPGVTSDESESDVLISSVDLYPTILATAGVTLPRNEVCDGIDQSEALRGFGLGRDFVFTYFPHGGKVNAKFIEGFQPSAAIRKGDWKLIRFFADGYKGNDRLELFNLRRDPGESDNLWESEKVRGEELNRLMDNLLRDTKSLTPTLNPNWDPEVEQVLSGMEK